MTVAFVTAAVLAILLVANSRRASKGAPPGRRGPVDSLERNGHSKAALLKAGAGLVLLAIALLGPLVAR